VRVFGSGRSERLEVKLDLHGLNVREALSIVRSACSHYSGSSVSSVSGPSLVLLVLIVGRGRHSKGNAPKLRPAVERMLNREGQELGVVAVEHHQDEFLVKQQMQPRHQERALANQGTGLCWIQKKGTI